MGSHESTITRPSAGLFFVEQFILSEIDKMNEIVIKQRASKQFTLLLLSILMIACSIFCVFLDVRVVVLAIVVRFFGIFGTLFFGFCFIFILYRLIKPKDILVIGEKGFIDNSTVKSKGFISWEYVDYIYIYSMPVVNEKFIAVKLKKNGNMDIPNIKADPFSKAEINITLNSTKEKYEDILQTMQTFLSSYLISRTSDNF
jgi:hypothetical protein